MEKVLITGGSGLIGEHLIPKLKADGFEVAILSRSRKGNPPVKTYLWVIEKQEIEEGAFDDVNHIIHLAGANLGEKRWSEKRKQLLVDSRAKTAGFLFQKFNETGKKLKTYVSASAIGYYGSITSEKIFSEDDPAADDFLGKLCSEWEKSADLFAHLSDRVVKLRTGVVLSRKGGALERMIKPIKAGIGSPLGNGKQYMPWIHIEDLGDIYLKTLKDKSVQGSYNAVSPDHTTNEEMTKAIAHTLNKRIWLPNVPAFLLKILFGEMSDIILKGSRISADKILKAGFNFKFGELNQALKDILK